MFKCLSNCAKCCGCVPIQRTVISHRHPAKAAGSMLKESA